ncbi:lipocalin family protein [Pedobacter sp. P351]|uniref:lipocalin family protein n=1 Tax=Pedobacter superstes TaxID=3133441 RepID=UPI0030A44153
MKNKIKVFLSFIVFVSFMYSCGQDTKNEIAKTWQLNDIETETKLVDSIKRAILLSSTFQFSEDGHYTSSGGIGADQGTYTLDKEGKILSTISSAGRNSDVYTIKDLDKDKLVLSSRGTTLNFSAVKP